MSARDELAGVLAAHALQPYDPACSCGWDWDASEVVLPSEVDFDSTRYRLPMDVRPRQHRAHVADALLASPQFARLIAAARAEAWDEAVQAVAWAQDNGPDPLRYVADHNPHRAALIAEPVAKSEETPT